MNAEALMWLLTLVPVAILIGLWIEHRQLTRQVEVLEAAQTQMRNEFCLAVSPDGADLCAQLAGHSTEHRSYGRYRWRAWDREASA